MQVTMKELRAMIREAIEECGGGMYEYELEENHDKNNSIEKAVVGMRQRAKEIEAGKREMPVIPDVSDKSTPEADDEPYDPRPGQLRKIGGTDELEEAWKELEEAAGLQEAAKKEEKKPAKAAEKKEAAEEEKPAKGGMMITKAQLMAALKLNPHQEKLFVSAINRNHSVADALKAAKK